MDTNFGKRIFFSEYISPHLAILTGMPRSAGINNYTIMHAVNVSLTLTGMLFSYTFNKVYLNKYHNHRFDKAERNLNQNLIDFKKLIVGILLGGGLILSLLYLQLNYSSISNIYSFDLDLDKLQTFKQS